MTRAELKADAHEQLSGNVFTLFIIAIVISAIYVLCAIVPVIGWIAALVIAPAFNLSLSTVYLMLTDNRKVSVGNAFVGFQKTGRALWLNILINFFTSLWSLLFVFPGIIKKYAYSMAYYVLADNPDFTAREALRESKRIMKGHKFDLFILELSFIFWNILVSITFGLAAIYVVPYKNATIANFYNSIK